MKICVYKTKKMLIIEVSTDSKDPFDGKRNFKLGTNKNLDGKLLITFKYLFYF